MHRAAGTDRPRLVAISGRTQLIAHLGWPTEAFKAPLIYNPWFASQSIDATVVPMGVEAADYPAVLRAVFAIRNVTGALVTMPHKVTTMGLVDRVSVTAQVAGAANAVRRGPGNTLEADMFDGTGFVRGMLGRGVVAARARALVVGAGGVGSAIAASLAGAGVAALTLHDRDPATAGALAARLARHYPALHVAVGGPDPAGHGIVVNATPLGMQAHDPLPLDPARLDPGCFVGEVVMAQTHTPLLRAALDRGCTVQVGTDMLYEMIPAYLTFFGYGTATAAQLRAVSGV